MKTHVCRNCLFYFYDEYRLLEHQLICLTNEPCMMKFPEEYWLSFKPKTYKIRVPFRVYCDVKCLIAKVESLEKRQTKNIYHQRPLAPGVFLYVIYLRY